MRHTSMSLLEPSSVQANMCKSVVVHGVRVGLRMRLRCTEHGQRRDVPRIIKPFLEFTYLFANTHSETFEI